MRILSRALVGATMTASIMFAGSASAMDITGAGATFPYPIYAKWADAYSAKTGVKLNYQSIGSGGGIKQITNKTVDFGASDMPLKPEDLEQKGMIQFPTVVGGVVPVINVSGVKPGELKLTGELLADIYMKKITRWDDPALKALNPSAKLPNAAIAVVHRSDGSGTTFIFTNYLSKVSSQWDKDVGANTSVSWPTGLGGKGNEGVASYVQRIKNSIGYVEFAYATENKMTYTLLKNAEGTFAEPSIEAFQSAAKFAKWDKAPGMYEILTNEPGKDTWPIAGATFILMHKAQDNPAKANEVLKFFNWSYKNGDKMAEDLHYVPMPDSVVDLINAHWKTNLKTKDGAGFVAAE
ncbi:MAG TPA: phosphate ABC transporter substrate-binding protein PstS [Methylophilaceae bacterium]|nr:phosphate ABC transporter substrate-binding protein PstS [Methylophilaceae bacterium]